MHIQRTPYCVLLIFLRKYGRTFIQEYRELYNNNWTLIKPSFHANVMICWFRRRWWKYSNIVSILFDLGYINFIVILQQIHIMWYYHFETKNYFCLFKSISISQCYDEQQFLCFSALYMSASVQMHSSAWDIIQLLFSNAWE